MTTRRSELYVATGLLAVGAVAAAAAVGLVLPVGGAIAVGVVLACIVVAASVRAPMTLPIMAMPIIIVVARLGGESGGLSISDFVLFIALWVVFFLGPRPLSPTMRSLLWLSVVYQCATMLTLIVNPYAANFIEWFHAWMLVAGALLVGWALGRSGHGSLALALVVAACAVIAVLTLVAAAQMIVHGTLRAVFLEWPYAMHKNYIGTTLVFAATVVYARPAWLGWSKRLCTGLFVLFSLAILASQARQAIISLGVVVVVIALRTSAGAWRSRVVLVPVALSVIVIAFALARQLANGNQFNSASQRLSWYADSVTIWHASPWFGVGLRWWYTTRFDVRFQPPNAELEVITSTGIVGLIGFVILTVGILFVLWTRLHPAYGTLAFSVVLARLVQGQLDLFWIAVSVSVPFLVAGICVGVAAKVESEAEAERPRYEHQRASGRHRLDAEVGV